MSNTFYTQSRENDILYVRLIKIILHLNVKEWARIYLEGMSD